MTNIFSAFFYILKGFKLIFKPGIRLYVVIPLLLNISLFSVVIWLGFTELGRVIDWLVAQLPDWLDWLSWLFTALLALIVALAVFFTFSIVANLVGAPFNGLLAEAVYKHLTGELPRGEEIAFWKNFGPAIKNELIKMRYILLWSLIGLGTLIIPVVNIIGPVIWFLISAWLLALEYMDYPMANHQIEFPAQRDRLQRRKWTVLSFGSGVSLATLTPFANFLVMPAAVAAATLIWVEKLQKDDAA